MNVSAIVRSGVSKKTVGSGLRRLFQTSSTNMVKQGDTLPNVNLYEDNPTNKINLAEIAADKKIIVFGVPGAFTPGCSKTHVPSYVKKADELKAQGVDEIFCIAVNDPFVMSAWGKDQNVGDKVRMLADPSAEFTKALNLNMDIPPLGGTRCKRFAMVVNKGAVVSLQVEPDGTGLSCSLADRIKL